MIQVIFTISKMSHQGDVVGCPSIIHPSIHPSIYLSINLISLCIYLSHHKLWKRDTNKPALAVLHQNKSKFIDTYTHTQTDTHTHFSIPRHGRPTAPWSCVLVVQWIHSLTTPTTIAIGTTLLVVIVVVVEDAGVRHVVVVGRDPTRCAICDLDD